MRTAEPERPSWEGVPVADLGAVDITSKAFAADPFGFWARLRSDRPVQPVRWTRGSTAWVVTRYADVIGVPEEDAVRFRRWTRALFGLTDDPLRNLPPVLLFLRYLRRLVTARARDPRDDLISAMVAARDEGDRLTDDEILSMLVLLLTAGHETTVNLIGMGTLALLEHPDQADLLRTRGDDPATVRTGIEELLRFTSPAETATERWTDRDVEIAGTEIPQGSLVLAVLASANRDPDVFTDPDRLDLTRSPNPHLAFGKGVHYCLGAPLARLEAQVAIPALLRRAPHLRRLDPGAPVTWRGTAIVRGLESLPVLL